MGIKLFDKDGSVQATVDWVASFLGCSDYSVVLADEAVNGSAMRRLANDITGLKLIGFKSGHAANLLDYFERLDVHQVAATSSPTPDAVPITPTTDPLASTTPHTHHRGSEPDCSRKNLHHPEPTNTGITYDQIFKEKAAGKVLLKTRYPLAWKNLHTSHALIRAWFRHYETDPLQFDLHENYRLNPDMKRKLNLFVSERISQLPPLVLVPGGETGTLSFEWKHETVYLHIIAHRQEFKKALKRRRSLSTADGDSDLELPPKKSQSSRPNSESGYACRPRDDHRPAHPLSTRTSNLSEDEPDMMSIIMKGGKFGLYALKDRPTIQHLQMRDCGTTPDTAVESVDFIGFGEPTKVCQNTPYKAYEVAILIQSRQYYSLHIIQNFLGVDEVPTMTNTIAAKPSNTAGGAAEVAPKNKNKEPEELMNTTSLEKECESNHFAEDSHKGQTTLQAFKRRVLAPKNADNLGEDSTPAPADSCGKTTDDGKRRSARGKGDAESTKCVSAVVSTNSESRSGQQPTKSTSGVDLHEVEVSRLTTATQAIITVRKTWEHLRLMLEPMFLNQDIYAKLSDEACVIVAMVVVGCNKKDDLPMGLTKYMVDVNKRQHKKQFRNHTNLNVGKKIDLVVERAFALGIVEVRGEGRWKRKRLHFSRANVRRIDHSYN
ncbi:hypothetical protein R1sor_020104 [Riccia sorocarpa]|uniref:SAM domain-containing protein n=1 Tax=Riccia sorocarpa TaxID=122646 RepID=A0ABD3IH61_9MARC